MQSVESRYSLYDLGIESLKVSDEAYFIEDIFSSRVLGVMGKMIVSNNTPGKH